MNMPMSKAEMRRLRLSSLLPGLPGQHEKKLAKSMVTPKRGYASELENRWLQSATVLRLDNGVVARSWGDGPKVLLVHGWNARGTQLCSYIEPLVRRGYEVVAIDLPGHGDSAGKFLTPAKARDALVAVGEQLGPLHSVVAHGYGAGAALWAMATRLEVSKLVVLAGWSHYLWREYAAMAQLSKRSLNLLEHQLEKVFKHSPRLVSVESFAAKIDKPVLLLHGKAESAVGHEHAVRNLTLLRTAKLKLLDGLNDMDLLFEPIAVDAVMRFVTEEHEAVAA